MGKSIFQGFATRKVAFTEKEGVWIHRPYDNSSYQHSEWWLAQVWVPRQGTGWNVRVDAMNARFVEGVDNSRRITDEFGKTRNFPTEKEAKDHAELCLRLQRMS
jgi:hypothetical protein